MTLVTDKEQSASFGAQIHSGRGTCFDLVLDDGTYLANAIAFDGRVVGLATGGHTGYVSLSDVPQVGGHSVSHWLRLRGYHFWPFIGRRLRHRWAQSMGVEPRHPDWRPKICVMRETWPNKSLQPTPRIAPVSSKASDAAWLSSSR